MSYTVNAGRNTLLLQDHDRYARHREKCTVQRKRRYKPTTPAWRLLVATPEGEVEAGIFHAVDDGKTVKRVGRQKLGKLDETVKQMLTGALAESLATGKLVVLK